MLNFYGGLGRFSGAERLLANEVLLLCHWLWLLLLLQRLIVSKSNFCRFGWSPRLLWLLFDLRLWIVEVIDALRVENMKDLLQEGEDVVS